MALDNGSRIAVMGGGPAGSFFSYFLLDMAQRVGVDLHLDIYESRNFSTAGPAGCNMCGGIISESLVQALATEGINLPPTVVKKGIDSYVLHMDVGTVRIRTPLDEMRIAAVHRGVGPRGIKETKWDSFDGYLLNLAKGKGALLKAERVNDVRLQDGKPLITTRGGSAEAYDLPVVAVGINSPTLKLFEGLKFGYASPKTTKTYISEFYLGQETVERYLGSSFHVLLLDIPRLEFAALIPKADYVTMCLLGEEIDENLVKTFLEAREVRECFPPDWNVPPDFCHCSPRLSIQGATQPFADRIVFIGDSGVSRLYKDGIGSAYRTAKAAAVTAIFDGLSDDDFRRHFFSACRTIINDNRLGKIVFAFTRQIQKRRYMKRGLLRMVVKEQQEVSGLRRMTMVLWDTFTGSAPYRDVFMRTIHPRFTSRLLLEIAYGLWPFSKMERKL